MKEILDFFTDRRSSNSSNVASVGCVSHSFAGTIYDLQNVAGSLLWLSLSSVAFLDTGP